ncbi:uncharacterized protein brk [Calliphora vicina]|uniref:uncharacterized protein brk n=1 Tax=Calliphora vicina TaxID=7373 RepID=UPI00325B543C
MENDHQTAKKSENFHKNKSGSSAKHTLNGENKEEIINMESTNNRNTHHASQVSLSSSKGVITNSNSPKMGSRRIFTPQFKLQVLESYRTDNDCKGNQRATARKYNIHRRQIQKWLQCESSLRSSVANINHSSVKHQFHNVSVQQQQQTKHVAITTHSSVSSSSYASSQLHSSHLCLDSTRGSASLNSMKVPSLSSCVTTPTNQGSHDIFEASNLAAVVAAAAASGTIPITSSSGTSPASTPVVSPLRPSVTIISNRNTNSAISPLLHHPHHYGIPPYSNMSSTVPILAHHLSNPQQHMHQQTLPTHQTSYQYHNMTYSPTISSHHHQTEKQQSSSYFTPISLPTINVLSAAASTASSYSGRDTELTNKLDLIPMGSKTYPKHELVSDKSPFLCNNNQGYANYECPESAGIINSSNINFASTINQLEENSSSYSTAYPFGPMDLSLRHRRDVKSEFVANIKSSFHNTEETPVRKEWNDKAGVVDLTYRKRRVLNMPHSSEDYKNEFSEKHLKLSNPDISLNKSLTYSPIEDCANHITTNSSNAHDDDDVEIEVGMEEKFPTSSKPVKLFKPYLLDECENKDSYISSNINKFSKTEHRQKLEQITTCCFSNGISTTTNNSNDPLTRDNTFPDVVKENINACVNGSNFLVDSRCESPRSACSPAAIVPTMSPTNFQCPKGSPASSGYESSTSTYSDSSSSSRNDTFTYGQTYCVNLQMQTIYNENIHVIHHPSKNVQKWLEKDDSKPLTSNSSIALLV